MQCNASSNDWKKALPEPKNVHADPAACQGPE
jgi:hypothetical protein